MKSEGPVARDIRARLAVAFAPSDLVIEDDSDRHAGHHHEGGIDGQAGGETHMNVRIVADAFSGMTRLQRQRAVNTCLAELLKGPVHALSIKALAPDE
ncbi:MAG: BolA family transcriptional regulator [Caulobacterales bacterium]|nr:BolA family transcriptional regulator [Caulobacterales bacterium]